MKLPTARPPSDVSSGVGIVGVAVLIGWVAFCRAWPIVADAFALPGPRGPANGPAAALVGLVVVGAAMALWSLGVDRVHRRTSTGIDWRLRRPWREIWPLSATKLVGLWATWAIIGFAYCVGRWFWVDPWRYAIGVIAGVAPWLVALSVPYVIWLDRRLVRPRDATWAFGRLVLGRDGWDAASIAAHLRIWAVKGFFTAFMLGILPGSFAGVVGADARGLLSYPVRLAETLIDALFLVDVGIGTVGYVLTSRVLDAHIRSAQGRLDGWVAALICYPPLVLMGDGGPLDYHQRAADWSDLVAGRLVLAWLWGGWLVLLTGVYAWATVAFGPRFSNLTWRGTLTHGPYRLTRHPAYLAKNLFWWSATLPFLPTSGHLSDALRNSVLLALVSAIYYWRARTEEAHLIAGDPKYAAYHAWAGAHAPITRALGAILRAFRRH